MGRPAAPTALKVVRGDRASRVNLREPTAPLADSVPSPPSWLAPEAKKVWRRLAHQLHERRLLTEFDPDLFATFCAATVRHAQACKIVDAEGIVQQTDDGSKKHPALQVIRDSQQIMLSVAREFGLTPAARAGIEMPELEDAKDAARRLLS